MTDEEAVEKLRDAVKEAGNQSRFAERSGLPQSYISDVLNGHRRPSDKLLMSIGLRRVLVPVERAAK